MFLLFLFSGGRTAVSTDVFGMFFRRNILVSVEPFATTTPLLSGLPIVQSIGKDRQVTGKASYRYVNYSSNTETIIPACTNVEYYSSQYGFDIFKRVGSFFQVACRQARQKSKRVSKNKKTKSHSLERISYTEEKKKKILIQTIIKSCPK